MFAGFLGQRRGDVVQNGFTQNTNMVLTNDNGLHFLTNLANPFPNGVAEPVGAAAGLQTYLGQGFTFFNPESRRSPSPSAGKPACSVSSRSSCWN